MHIGLLGFSVDNANLGCVALTYSIFIIIEQISNEINEKISYTVFGYEPTKVDIERIRNLCASTGVQIERIQFVNLKHFIKSIRVRRNVRSYIRKCDLIIDSTEGDSFSDIYGIKRILNSIAIKYMVLHQRVSLVLAPQTYGPYKHWYIRLLAINIINRSSLVVTRDIHSYEYLKKYTKRDIKISTDIAFVLPYCKEVPSIHSKLRVGLNCSGLLWNGGYNGTNQFELILDYREVCTQIAGWLLLNNYEVHLIAHVDSSDLKCVESDSYANNALKEIFPQIYVAPRFDSPIAAKSYISSLDCFIGSRMHATIASFSTGVPTIYISYSGKFEGLYKNLGYNIGINGKATSTQDAVNILVGYVRNIEMLRNHLYKTNECVSLMKDEIYKVFMMEIRRHIRF